jgi:hypothetical protein
MAESLSFVWANVEKPTAKKQQSSSSEPAAESGWRTVFQA